MGFVYMAICIFDFIVAPILWSLLQAYQSGVVSQQWDPITLAGAGLFHAAMGAVLGVAAWTRGRERMEMMTYNRETGDYYDNEYDEPRGSRYRGSRRPKVKYRPGQGQDDNDFF